MILGHCCRFLNRVQMVWNLPSISHCPHVTGDERSWLTLPAALRGFIDGKAEAQGGGNSSFNFFSEHFLVSVGLSVSSFHVHLLDQTQVPKIQAVNTMCVYVLIHQCHDSLHQVT